MARWRLPEARRQAPAIRQGVRLLAAAGEPPRQPLALPGQVFDRELLALSSLFRRSRELYRAEGGTFSPALVSSPRTLSSPILLEPRIEYSPIAEELVWAATDRGQARDDAHLLLLRTFSSSLFHEQNHRILWKRLPPPPRSGAPLRRYLNFAESLVVTLDMALGDELGPRLAPFFHLVGATYDPGTSVRSEAGSRRAYRNYLQAALHATYLHLEGYAEADIARLSQGLFPGLGPLAERAARRSCQLDLKFVAYTNPVWQKRHAAGAARRLARRGEEALVLAEDPRDHRLQYLVAEGVLAELGL